MEEESTSEHSWLESDFDFALRQQPATPKIVQAVHVPPQPDQRSTLPVDIGLFQSLQNLSRVSFFFFFLSFSCFLFRLCFVLYRKTEKERAMRETKEKGEQGGQKKKYYRFLSSETTQRQRIQNNRRPPKEILRLKEEIECWYYKRGYCTWGTSCRFKHGDERTD